MLTIIDDITKLSAGSQKEVKAICNCGREILLPLKKAIKQSTCGKCTRKPREWWLSQKWGNLVLDPNQDLPNEWAPGTHVIFNFLCDCGKSYHSNPQRLLMGRAVTCGKCNDLSIKSVLQMSWNKMRLSPEQNLPSFLSLKSNKSFDFLMFGRLKAFCFGNGAGRDGGRLATTLGRAGRTSEVFPTFSQFGFAARFNLRR